MKQIQSSVQVLREAAVLGVSAIALLVFPITAQATSLIVNGGFESNTGNGQVGFNTTVTGWTVSGGGGGSYTFLYAPGTADTTGSNGAYGNVSLWGPGNGVANGLPATSPAGGYYIAQDADFQQSPIQQTITGLNPGTTYLLGFYWGAAQQVGFTGGSSEQWQVSLGSDTQSTALLPIGSEGFSGWQFQTLDFTATSSSELLSFLASSTASGVPPFALLDGVTLTSASTATPEPETLTLLFTGLMGSLGALRLRKRFKR